MAEVKQDSRFSQIVDQLTASREELDGHGVFRRYKDLMKFAAMVGYRHKTRTSVDHADREIPQRIFENSNDNDIIYLLALVESQDVDILAGDDEAEAYRIFEEYANGGLSIIEAWLEEMPNDLIGVRALLTHIYQELGKESEDFGEEVEF